MNAYRKLTAVIRILTLSAFLVAFGTAIIARGADQKDTPLPKLDGPSAKGLQIECHVQQTKYAVGEPVNIWCAVTNTTDNIKPIGWHPSTGLHFCCVQGDTASFEGLLPLVIPQIRDSLLIKSKDSQPGYIIYLPPHKSLQLLLTYKAERPIKFRGKVVYDPLDPRNGFAASTKEKGPPWKNEWVYSNTFEYEVVE